MYYYPNNKLMLFLLIIFLLPSHSATAESALISNVNGNILSTAKEFVQFRANLIEDDLVTKLFAERNLNLSLIENE